MKRIVVLILLLSLSLVVTSCYEGRGYAYKHLQEQDVTKRHVLTGDESNLTNLTSTAGVFEHLNKNLCATNRHCCGDYTEEEIALKDLEQRAIVEENADLCLKLPPEDLVVKCPNEEPIVYYSRTRCLEHFD